MEYRYVSMLKRPGYYIERTTVYGSNYYLAHDVQYWWTEKKENAHVFEDKLDALNKYMEALKEFSNKDDLLRRITTYDMDENIIDDLSFDRSSEATKRFREKL